MIKIVNLTNLFPKIVSVIFKYSAIVHIAKVKSQVMVLVRESHIAAGKVGLQLLISPR